MLRALMTGLVNVLKAMVSLGAPVMKWCARSGKWVIDHAATAAKALAAAAGSTLTWAADFTGRVASIPGKMLGGGGGGMPMPSPRDEDKDHARRMRDVQAATEALKAGRQPLLRATPQVVPFASRAAIGEAVHQYASADRDERLGLDLDGLPGHVRTWLLTRSEQELVKLAVAGADRCADVATGRRGIPGVARPDANGNLDMGAIMAGAAAAPYLAKGEPIRALDADHVMANSAYAGMVAARVARAKEAAPAYAPAPRMVM